MDYQRLEKEIKNGICSLIEHIKPKPYWDDVNSFCLFTDESFMSLSLIFNTTRYFNKVKDINYPLTYKYSPSEWFSESLTEQDDAFIFTNRAFSKASDLLTQYHDKEEFPIHRRNVISTCVNSMGLSVNEGLFQKSRDLIYLFMISDCYEGREILEWNHGINNPSVNCELKKWIENEL